MTTWLVLNSVGLAIVMVVLYLVLRQVGFVLRRVGPSGARASPVGPRIGENLSLHIRDVHRDALHKAVLLVFVSEVCSICGAVRKAAEALAEVWKSDAQILLVYDCMHADGETPAERKSDSLYVQRSMGFRESLEVTFVPFAIVMTPDGTVIGKGLVNEISHLESLLELERTSRAGLEPTESVFGQPARIT